LEDLTNKEDYLPFQHNNYKGNAGNQLGATTSVTNAITGTASLQEANNGVFLTNKSVSIDQITDGSSNTALFSEAVLGDGNNSKLSIPGDWILVTSLATDTTPADFYAQAAYALSADGTNTPQLTSPGPLNPTIALPGGTQPSTSAYVDPSATGSPSGGGTAQFSFGGRNWWAGNYVATRYNHVVTPNLASIATDLGEQTATSPILPGNPNINETSNASTASSRHGGGVNLALADGSVTFINDNIAPGIWWALGSIAGGPSEAAASFGTASPQ
jgi:prepilin-type processing-associated H-X9-DG protein